ncbi:hypothetical protein LZ554_000400 [Drepanopeziza brunnea f. sp. 'monogermtubi']|nr:hypothetical protein LZ554_000400 [Drepanopeziza brunnea f. sp. 'monogermtubi']
MALASYVMGGWNPLFVLKRRYARLLALCVLSLFALLYVSRQYVFARASNAITEIDTSFERFRTSSANKLKPLDNGLSLSATPYMTSPSKYCHSHGWKVYPLGEPRRKIYDLFMINTELDWLEIRLHTLQNHVDFFVVLESATTFTGLPKNLSLAENWPRFEAFRHKIIYHVLDLEDTTVIRGAWDKESFQRNAMFSQVFPILTGVQAPNVGDVILVSDVDEIPRPETLTLLYNCQFPRRLTLRSKFYYYSFQWLHRGEEWAHPQATTYTGLNSTILPNDLRGDVGVSFIDFEGEEQDLYNAAWHCSYCLSTLSEMLVKVRSFSHTEYNTAEYLDEVRIVDRVRNGKDLWDRSDELYDKVGGNEDVPGYLKVAGMGERFGYLLDRDGESGGFSDYVPGEKLAQML